MNYVGTSGSLAFKGSAVHRCGSSMPIAVSRLLRSQRQVEQRWLYSILCI